jgi:hypothetical protein
VTISAYDIEMLQRPADRNAPDNQGWCFGLPPGIRQEQRPLDPNTGYPLMHGFTLLLPEDYRVHGPDRVALSFFALAIDHFEESNASLQAFFASPGGQAPNDPELLPFWHAIQAEHPHLHRMEDILGGSYAVILLTQQEFDGPLCEPPRFPGNRHLSALPAPRWLQIGAAGAFCGNEDEPDFNASIEGNHVLKQLGEVPANDLMFNRALRWMPRNSDPNAGKPPREGRAAKESGYQSFYYWHNGDIKTENYRIHDWAQGHQQNHIGGTMRPIQAIPEFSPYYIGFEEYLGGYNFGSGNAQLDIKDMKFDWACG